MKTFLCRLGILLFIIGLFLCVTLIFAQQQEARMSIAVIGGGVPAGGGSIGTIVHDLEGELTAGYIYHSDFTTTTAGDVTYIHAYVRGAANRTFALAIYNVIGTCLGWVEVSDVVGEEAQWVNKPLNTTVTLSAATVYYLGCQVAENTIYMGKQNAGDGIWYDTIAYDADGNVNPKESEWDMDDNITIIVNNSAGSPE